MFSIWAIVRTFYVAMRTFCRLALAGLLPACFLPRRRFVLPCRLFKRARRFFFWLLTSHYCITLRCPMSPQQPPARCLRKEAPELRRWRSSVPAYSSCPWLEDHDDVGPAQPRTCLFSSVPAPSPANGRSYFTLCRREIKPIDKNMHKIQNREKD